MTIKIKLTKKDLERLSKTKKNPQDATLRNIRALKKRITKLEGMFNGFLSAYYDLSDIKKAAYNLNDIKKAAPAKKKK